MRWSDLKILYLIGEAFRDEEYLYPSLKLQELGADITITGVQAGEVLGMLNAIAKINHAAQDVNTDSYHAMVLAGGDGTPELRRHPEIIDLVRRFFKSMRPCGAICWSPSILAEAGLLKGRVVAACCVPECVPYVGLNSHEMIQKRGGLIAQNPVNRDGMLVSAAGPSLVQPFTELLIQTISECYGLNATHA